MSHRADLDSDSSRLPEGFRRTGYDAHEQLYYYEDSEGNAWQGASGSRYGPLHRVGTKPPPMAAAEEQAMRENNRAAWRYMFPFFLLVGVFILLIVFFMRKGSTAEPLFCGDDSIQYQIGNGNTCWSIADHYKTSVDELIRENKGLDCDHLAIGKRICVPKGS